MLTFSNAFLAFCAWRTSALVSRSLDFILTGPPAHSRGGLMGVVSVCRMMLSFAGVSGVGDGVTGAGWPRWLMTRRDIATHSPDHQYKQQRNTTLLAMKD
jgi:hypothetical protein